jgi:CRISPR type III-A-associated RAMP protein Csm5
MNNHSYLKIKLEIITPVFIGDGNEYLPFDYILQNKKIKIIDKQRFNNRIYKDQELFEEFSKVSDNTQSLIDFLNINVNEYSYEIDVENSAYEDLIRNKGSIRRPVSNFIKDKYYNTPFIPGSSLKGAVRTALLDYVFANNSELKSLFQKEKYYKSLEAEVFCNDGRFDAKNDCLKALSISDLKPAEYKLKAIKPKNKGLKNENLLPVILECVCSGIFEGEIRIDENLLKRNSSKYFKLNFDEIKNALEFHYKNVIENETKRFNANIPNYCDYMMKLGKHGGAGAKTIEGKRNIWIHTIRKNLDYQLSTWLDSQNNQLGWAKLSFGTE